LAGSYSNNVTVISGTTNSVVGAIPVGLNPFGIAYDSSNGDLYVSNGGGSNVTVIDAATSATVASIPVGSGLMSAAFDSSNGYVYVASSGQNATMIINPATNKVVGSIPVGTSPWDLIYDSRNGNLYTTNTGSDNVSVIDGLSNRVVANVPAGDSPTSICFQPDSDLLYVANPDSNNVTVFNGSTNSPVTNIASSRDYPRGVVCDPDNGMTYVMDEQAGTVDMINGTTNALSGSIPVGSYPNYGIFDNLNGNLYIADLLEYEVYVIAPSGSPGIHIDYFQASPSSLVLGGTSYLNVSAAGGLPPYTYAYTGLPAGCSTASTSTLACKPTATGSFTIRVYVNDTKGNSSSATTTLTTGNISTVISSVSVSPPSYTLPVGGRLSIAAIPTCKGGPCSPGVTYAWSLTNTLGALNSSSGSTVKFTAAGLEGIDTLFVNATLGGTTVLSPAVPITILTQLSSVGISPVSSALQVRAAANFTASVTCTGGSCPAGATYAWSLNNTLGSIGPTSGTSTTFTAGSSPGTEALTVNATLNGGYKTATATISILPPLASVAISPPSDTLSAGENATFIATPTCTGGPCPGGTTYSWKVNNTLGNVNNSTGPKDTFTAGSKAGSVTMTVNATLNGMTATSSATITITSTSLPTLTSVSISPSPAFVTVNSVQAFAAALTCSGGSCPSGASYAWSLTSSLGTLSPSSGSSVTFTAGVKTGTVTLLVNATLNGKTVESLPVVITIGTNSSPPTTGFLGLSGNLGYILLGVAVAIVAVVVAVLLLWLKRMREGKPVPPPPLP
jgi:YVTN family beta-propeller protein